MTNYAKGNGSTPVIVFRGHAARTMEIDYAPAKNYQNPSDDIYDFVASNADMQIWNYLNQQGSYTYSPPPPPTVIVPDLQSFVQALRAEPTFTPAIRFGLSSLLHMDMGRVDPASLQQDWQDLVAVYGPSWLTPSVQSTIKTYAQKYNVALVAA